MNAALEAIREQNRLISEQNALLRKLAMQSEIRAQEEMQSSGRMMTERDLQLILNSDDILAAADRWNESCGHGRGKRRARV